MEEPERQLAARLARTPWDMVSLAIEKGIDPGQLGKLVDFAERLEENQARQAYATALAGFQADCPMIVKRRPVLDRNGKEGYRFAGYEDVMVICRPHLHKWGIAHSFSTPACSAGLYQIVCTLSVGSYHRDHPFTCPMPNILELAKASFCNEAQATGIWMSYQKRYAFCAAAGVVVCNEDTDAAARGVEPLSKFPDKLAELIQAIDDGGIDLQAVLKAYQIADLGQLPSGLYDDAMMRVSRKAKQKGAKS